MQSHSEKKYVDKSRAASETVTQNRTGGGATFQFVDNRSAIVAQGKLKAMIDHSSLKKQQVFQRKEIHGGEEGPITEDLHHDSGRSENGAFSPTQNSEAVQLSSTVIQRGKAKPKPKPKAKKKKHHMNDGIKQKMTVRNKIDSYSSGVINNLYRATGVEKGPRAEAQKVQKFFGGTWVGGHMVNDQLGGSGGFKNIVPITSSMNGLHKYIENRANNYLSAQDGTSIEYKMKILERATVSNGVKTVDNLPIEFQQTLIVHPANGVKKKIVGPVLIEDRPGDGKVVP